MLFNSEIIPLSPHRSPLSRYHSHFVYPIFLPMAPLSFEQRATSGCYDKLAVAYDQKPDSIATVDYGTHFTSEFGAWRDGGVKNHRTTFVPIDKSLQEGAGEELVVNIIGEVAREGSELSALGNTWLKRNQKILEKNSAKDVLVLVLPTMATPALTILYENQICTLETLEDSVMLPAPKVCFTSLTTPPPYSPRLQTGTKVTHCVRPTGSEGSTIVITFPHKFRVSLLGLRHLVTPFTWETRLQMKTSMPSVPN